jgi:hypothetical protein
LLLSFKIACNFCNEEISLVRHSSLYRAALGR